MKAQGFIVRRVPSVDLEYEDKERIAQQQKRLKNVIKTVTEYFENAPFKHIKNEEYPVTFKAGRNKFKLRKSGSPEVRVKNGFATNQPK